MDCGLAAGIPFVTTAGVGLDAEIGWEFANLNGRGMRNYIRATAELYFRYKPRTFELEVDGHQLQRRALLLTFANASQFGNNALIAPTARVDDGQLTLVVVRPFPKVAIGFLAALLFQGLVDRTSYVETINFTRLRVRCSEAKVHGHVDGEPVTFPGEFGVEICPSALQMVAGSQAPELTGISPRLFLTPRNLVKRMRAAGIEGRFARLYGGTSSPQEPKIAARALPLHLQNKNWGSRIRSSAPHFLHHAYFTSMLLRCLRGSSCRLGSCTVSTPLS